MVDNGRIPLVEATVIPFCTALILTMFGFPEAPGIRPATPIVVTGSDLTDHLNQPVDQLHLYALVNGAWEYIAFQIDEKGPDGSFFTPDDGLLDANDELAFQPQDGGERAAIHLWPDHPGFTSAPRLEIEITDPVDGGTAYVYLFHSETPLTPPVFNWLDYDEAADLVTGHGYGAGFDLSLRFMDQLWFFDEQQTTPDLLDREKLRVQGTFIILPFTLTEEDIVPVDFMALAGPTRVIRHVSGEITLAGNVVPVELQRHYYRRSMNAPTDLANFGGGLPPGLTINDIRISLDYSVDAIGGQVSDPNNGGLLVDGVPDPGVQTSITPAQAEAYWIGFEWEDYALFLGSRFSGVSTDPRFYYHDNAGGGTADGTPDTGDMASYGDMGLRLPDPATSGITGAFATFLDLDGLLTGPKAAAYLASPLTILFQTDLYEQSYGTWLSLWAGPDPNAPDMAFLVNFINQHPQ